MTNTPANTFADFALPEQMLAALKRLNFTTPTPIQSRAIPLILQGRDVLGSAQTGTGKTGAFCIPVIAMLMADETATGLILTPTRELASQILDVVHKLTANNRAIRTALLIGGDSMGKQFAQLRERPRLIVGTPGRINDHLRRDPRLLAKVAFITIDEADRMLDMGFSAQLDEILATLPKQRQTMMFSATFPDAIIKFSRNYLNNPERISIGTQSAAAPKIKHEVKKTSADKKHTDLLAELEMREGSVIIFVKTQHGTERLAKKLCADNHAATPIHGGLRQNQRDRAVRDFRAMRTRILVATDVASRGLDIPHIEHVINYDLPQVAEDYIHRIGRTARAGAGGNAIAFVTPSDMQMWNAINHLMNPNAPMERVVGPQGNRRQGNRQGGFKTGGFKSGGYKGKGNHTGFKARNNTNHYSKGPGKPARSRDEREFKNRDPQTHDFQGRAARPSSNRNHRFDGHPREERYEQPRTGQQPTRSKQYGPRSEGQKPRNGTAFKAHTDPRKAFPGNKPKSAPKKPAAKAPFKFKKHSRKPSRKVS